VRDIGKGRGERRVKGRRERLISTDVDN